MTTIIVNMSDPLRVDDLAKALLISKHAAVECHVTSTGGPDSLRLDTSALAKKGLALGIVVDQCPKGARLSKRGVRGLDAYLVHFVPADGALSPDDLSTLLHLIRACVKTRSRRQPEVETLARPTARVLSKAIFV
jgi:hypothetical protein